MKQLEAETRPTHEIAARELLETMPLIMRTIRRQMRGHEPGGLSIPQFRTLGFLMFNEGASLSDLAEHLGLALPSMSKMIDNLIARKLVRRQQHTEDRRRLVLNVTERGSELLRQAGDMLTAFLGGTLEPLSAEEKEQVVRTMRLLRGVFGNGTNSRTSCR